MALVSLITIDLVTQTVTLTTTVSGNSVETIIYNDLNKQINFALRPLINISIKDFLDYIAQVNIFQQAIFFNFNPSIAETLPFGSCSNVENHDVGLNEWNLLCVYGALPRVCNYSCNIGSQTVNLANRVNAKTIEFPEWIYFLQALNHYRASIKAL